MQRQLSFLEAPLPAGSAPVWPQLDGEHRIEVTGILARLIAKMTMAPHEASGVHPEEKNDE